MGDEPKGTDERDGALSATPYHDSQRLAELERRLADVRAIDRRQSAPGVQKFDQANLAWRMVTELVAGLALGLGIGYGLDRLLGTMPLMLVIFVLVGLIAGIKTMLRTAAQVQNGPTGSGNDKVGDADKDERV